MFQVLMNSTDPSKDDTAKQLMSLYGINLDFCAKNGGRVLKALRKKHYDAVILYDDLPDLALISVKRQYEDGASDSTLLPQPDTLFFALLSPAPNNGSAINDYLAAGFCGAQSPPYSENALALHILNSLRDITQQYHSRQNELRHIICEELLRSGCPSHLKGFYHLSECLLYLSHDPMALYSATKVLYPEVARILKTSASNLERSMRSAIDHMWVDGAPALIGQYFTSPQKVCITQLLSVMLQKLHQRKYQWQPNLQDTAELPIAANEAYRLRSWSSLPKCNTGETSAAFFIRE